MHAPAGSADVGGGAVQQPGVAEPDECGEPVAGRVVLVDVQDVGAGGAGGDGQVGSGVAGEPVGDLPGVGAGVAVAEGGGGDLLAGLAGGDRPAAGGVAQGLAEGVVGHGVLRGRGWPQRVVSAASWAARAGRMRAWYSAWADSSALSRPGWRYSTDHRAEAMSRAYRHKSWAGQHGPRAAARWP